MVQLKKKAPGIHAAEELTKNHFLLFFFSFRFASTATDADLVRGYKDADPHDGDHSKTFRVTATGV